MLYLDSDTASVIYKTKADIIKKNNLVGIVDVGCRVGAVNKFLELYDYNYYGFDTSSEPIKWAKEHYPLKEFEDRSWDELIQPTFTVDTVIFGSVLIYDSDPRGMFERICNFYTPTHAIVHEVTSDNHEDLNYTDLDYFFKNYECNSVNLDLDIPVGKRIIIDVKYR
jgi:2-polyprenyl-3-methyl-5-hydroxy-6-metoxy-1,4-benzoquinol methylase